MVGLDFEKVGDWNKDWADDPQTWRPGPVQARDQASGVRTKSIAEAQGFPLNPACQ